MTKRRMLIGPLGPDFVHEVSQWQHALGAEFRFSREDQYRFDLCLEELVTNVVNHSDPQHANLPVELHAVIGTQRVTLTIVDQCAPFDPLSLPPPRAVEKLEELRIGGQGVQLVREFSDACRYERHDDKNKLELVFEMAQPTMTESIKARQLRGPDRRRNSEPPVFPLLCGGEQLEQDRRQAQDRRAMGFVSSVNIFRGVPYAALEDLLGGLTIQDIAGEMVLLRPGEPNRTVRVVLRGRLKVYLDQPGIGDFIEVSAGACVGEMSVIDNQPVSAYVLAEPGTRLLLIDADTFINRIMTIPGVSRNLMSAMSERMRRSDQLTIQRVRKLMETEQARRELQYARAIQESLLPKEPLFPDRPQLDCVGRMCTAREVGGDFYDLFFLDARHLFFVIADVCGKGLPAALFMVRAIAVLRAQSGHEGQTEGYAEKLIASLNEQLCAYNDAQQFLTAFCGILDLDTLTVRYINAGHNPPALAIGAAAFQYLEEPTNPIVGMIDGLSYRAGEVKLEPGSVFLLYTDGVTEAEDSDGNMLGDDRLLAHLNAQSARTAGHLVTSVFADVDLFAGDAVQSDDITVLAIRCPAA